MEIDSSFYSVPYQLRREQLETRITSRTVEVFHRNKRVASHMRSNRARQHVTLNEHMPEAHRQYAEWTPQRLIRWAEKNGPATADVITGIMESRLHPQHGFRSCLGIMRLAKKYSSERLEAACQRALAINALSYKSIQSILDTGLDSKPLKPAVTDKPAIRHGNIRGASYYTGKEDS